MIYDCVLFFNELDLLKIRLEELKGIVDRFVISEATRTFRNRPKPFYFLDHKDEFNDVSSQIIHNRVESYPLVSRFFEGNMEHYQRNAIKKKLTQIGCNDEDVILLSDADEIPSVEGIKEAVKLLNTHNFVVFEHKMYVQYLNWISNERSVGTLTARYRDLKKLPLSQTRFRLHAGNFPHVKNGCHFTGFGGYDAFIYKLQNYGHAVFDKTNQYSLNYIAHSCGRSNLHNNQQFRLEFLEKYHFHHTYTNFSKVDVRNSDFIITDSEWPEFLKRNIKMYPHFFYFTEPANEPMKLPPIFSKSYTVQMRIYDKTIFWLINLFRLYRMKVKRILFRILRK
jgi:beta-1,4-mannosyl-glycoprotein beta-1,4-N-acetylglucosaminyltransferase